MQKMKMNIIILLGIHLMTCCNSESNGGNKSATFTVQGIIFENDSILCRDIAVSTFKIGDSKDKFEKLLGRPDSVIEVIDSVDSPTFVYEALLYDESEFYIYKGRLFGFSLQNSKFDFNSVAVGDSISKLKKEYPKSFDKGLHGKYNQVIINCYNCKLEESKLLGPDRIIISYDENKLIKRIVAFIY
jgi:hypothetical protein